MEKDIIYTVFEDIFHDGHYVVAFETNDGDWRFLWLAATNREDAAEEAKKKMELLSIDPFT